MVRHPEKILVRIEKRGGERHPKTIILFSSFSEIFLRQQIKGKCKSIWGRRKEGEQERTRMWREKGEGVRNEGENEGKGGGEKVREEEKK